MYYHSLNGLIGQHNSYEKILLVAVRRQMIQLSRVKTLKHATIYRVEKIAKTRNVTYGNLRFGPENIFIIFVTIIVFF